MKDYGLEMAYHKQAMLLAEAQHDAMVMEAKENEEKQSLWQYLTSMMKSEPKKETAKQY